MTFRNFLEVVEIKTKIASVIPFVVGVLFSVTYFNSFNLGYTALFFVAMIIFDMTVTAINNYMDFVKAKSDNYKYKENVIGRENLSQGLVAGLIIFMITVSATLGFILVYFTGWALLFMGLVCCFIGVFYTFGPVPLSRMPLGELFSGFTMGLGIFAMVVYINTISPNVFFVDIDFAQGTFLVTGSLWAVLAMLLASLPIVFTIANIMLENNLRDLQSDIKNHRYTLVYYIGTKAGIILFSVLMYACYVIILIGVFFEVFGWPVLITFATLPKIHKNLKAHRGIVPQPFSFVYSLKNMVLFNGSYVLGYVLIIVFGLWF
ncbi:MAG: 1,4-dihydroxy-2-naphthoate polyprenyltransferase [Defluviitaleaceae bacterium]|nr:1,4-dihydroxy-2-naphthoate polyprenyltransferase [Defluviitaleaceae bacterium]